VIRLNLWSTRALFVRTTAGAIGIRLSLRPLFLGRVKLMQTSGASRRGEADSCGATSLRGARATKQSSFLCRRAKAGLLRFARNDGVRTVVAL
jgi:hypothetical protein